jgi:hypothetical protein
MDRTALFRLLTEAEGQIVAARRRVTTEEQRLSAAEREGTGAERARRRLAISREVLELHQSDRAAILAELGLVPPRRDD